MLDPFVCQITLFAFNFAPVGWAPCAGQILPISQNTAVYTLIGNAYGGDGKTTFALPDYRSLAPQGMQYCIALQGVWPQGGGSDTVVAEMALLPYQQLTPEGWMNCAGQLLPIDDDQVLFQLLGTTFGGDGETTFGLPNLTATPPPPSPLAAQGSSLYFISLFGMFEAPKAFLGTVQLLPLADAPRGWAACNGQVLPIARFPALYSLIGTTYGGDGETTFALPDLRQLAVPHGTQYFICINAMQPARPA